MSELPSDFPLGKLRKPLPGWSAPLSPRAPSPDPPAPEQPYYLKNMGRGRKSQRAPVRVEDSEAGRARRGLYSSHSVPGMTTADDAHISSATADSTSADGAAPAQGPSTADMGGGGLVGLPLQHRGTVEPHRQGRPHTASGSVRPRSHVPVHSMTSGKYVASTQSLPFHKKKTMQKRFEQETLKLLGNVSLSGVVKADIGLKLQQLQEHLEQCESGRASSKATGVGGIGTAAAAAVAAAAGASPSPMRSASQRAHTSFASPVAGRQLAQMAHTQPADAQMDSLSDTPGGLRAAQSMPHLALQGGWAAEGQQMGTSAGGNQGEREAGVPGGGPDAQRLRQLGVGRLRARRQGGAQRGGSGTVPGRGHATGTSTGQNTFVVDVSTVRPPPAEQVHSIGTVAVRRNAQLREWQANHEGAMEAERRQMADLRAQQESELATLRRRHQDDIERLRQQQLQQRQVQGEPSLQGQSRRTTSAAGAAGEEWDLLELSSCYALRLATGGNCVTHSPDGSVIACGHEHGVTLWAESGGGEQDYGVGGGQGGLSQCSTLTSIEGGCTVGLRWSPHGNLLAAGCFDDCKVHLWVAAGTGSGTLWQSIEDDCLEQSFGHSDWVRAVAFSAAGDMVASGGNDRKVKIWDLSPGAAAGQGRPTLRFRHSGAITALDWCHGGEAEALVAAGDAAGDVKLYDPREPRVVETLQQSGSVSELRWAADGRHMLVASDAAAPVPFLQLYDVRWMSAKADTQLQRTGGYRAVLGEDGAGASGDARCTAAALGCAGALAFSGCSDGTVKLWDVPSGRCLKAFSDHQERVRGLSWCDVTKQAVSVSDDGVARVYTAVSRSERAPHI